MPCSLMVPSHYLNHGWHIIDSALCYSHDDKFPLNYGDANKNNSFQIKKLKLQTHISGRNELSITSFLTLLSKTVPFSFCTVDEIAVRGRPARIPSNA